MPVIGLQYGSFEVSTIWRRMLGTVSIYPILAGGAIAASQQGELMVQMHCSACHSLALVYAQNGDTRFWRTTIDLMSEQHNLQIPLEREVVIIDYLARQSTTGPDVRRIPLEAMFLPDPQSAVSP